MRDAAGPRLQEPDQNVEELHQCIKEEWDSLDQRVIDSAIREWHERLHSVLQLTENISNMQCEYDCFASWFIAARLLDH